MDLVTKASSFLNLRTRKIMKTPSASSAASYVSVAASSEFEGRPIVSINASGTENILSSSSLANNNLSPVTSSLPPSTLCVSTSSPTIFSNATSNNTDILAWAQNLTTPCVTAVDSNFSRFNASLPCSSAFSPPVSISLPQFWESDVDLWFAAIEQQFQLRNVFDERERFSYVLAALDFNVIRKIQYVVRNPGPNPYLFLKQALVKSYAISENDRFDILLNRLELGDRKPTELLAEMRVLLDAFGSNKPELNPLLKKLLLDKLPLEVKTVLAGFSHLTLDETAQRADDILATVKTNLSPSTNPAASQHLFNQVIEQ